jgi:hypothetical protein
MMAAAVKVGDLQPHSVTIDKLVSLFELYLRFRRIAKLDSALERCLAFGLDDIFAVVGFVYQHADFLLRYLNDAAGNSEEVQLAVWIAFFVTDGYGTRNGNRNKRLMAGENGNFALFGWDHDFVGFLVYFFAKQGNKF